MISKTLYVCEVCHTEYADKNEAKKCEEVHKKGMNYKIVKQRFLSYKQDKSGFPVTITIQDQAGNTATYKR